MIILAYALLILVLAWLGAAVAGIPGLVIVLLVSVGYLAWRADHADPPTIPAGTTPGTSDHSRKVCERCQMNPVRADGGRICAQCEGELLEAERG
jgi:hypothetical protein